MRENSIRFEFVVLRASDIAIQTPFGTRVTGSPVREAPYLHARVTRGPAGPASGVVPETAPPWPR